MKPQYYKEFSVEVLRPVGILGRALQGENRYACTHILLSLVMMIT